MATVIEKRPDGSVVIVVPATDAAELKVGALVDVRPVGAAGELPCPFGALAGKYPAFGAEEIESARREALTAGLRNLGDSRK